MSMPALRQPRAAPHTHHRELRHLAGLRGLRGAATSLSGQCGEEGGWRISRDKARVSVLWRRKGGMEPAGQAMRLQVRGGAMKPARAHRANIGCRRSVHAGAQLVPGGPTGPRARPWQALQAQRDRLLPLAACRAAGAVLGHLQQRGAPLAGQVVGPANPFGGQLWQQRGRGSTVGTMQLSMALAVLRLRVCWACGARQSAGWRQPGRLTQEGRSCMPHVSPDAVDSPAAHLCTHTGLHLWVWWQGGLQTAGPS